MTIFNLDNLRKTSVYITPNFPSLQTKRYKFGFFSLLSYLILYSASICVLFALVVTFTPLHEFLLLIETEKIEEQSQKIEQLEEQVLFLSKELQSMSATNKRLKYAIMLAGTDSLDSTAAIYDSLRHYQEVNPSLDGSILSAFNSLLSFLSDTNEKEAFFVKPTRGIIINHFDPVNGHNGIDYAIKKNSPVYAADEGYVIFSDFTPKDGFVMIIQHENEYKTFYKHCSRLLKKEREFVRKGEIIALSGNTGYNTTGSHLHFEIWKDGKPVNPENLLTK